MFDPLLILWHTDDDSDNEPTVTEVVRIVEISIFIALSFTFFGLIIVKLREEVNWRYIDVFRVCQYLTLLVLIFTEKLYRFMEIILFWHKPVPIIGILRMLEWSLYIYFLIDQLLWIVLIKHISMMKHWWNELNLSGTFETSVAGFSQKYLSNIRHSVLKFEKKVITRFWCFLIFIIAVNITRAITDYTSPKAFKILGLAMSYFDSMVILCLAISLSFIYFKVRTILRDHLNFFYNQVKAKMLKLYIVNTWYFFVLVLYRISAMIFDIDFQSIRDHENNSGIRMVFALVQNLFSHIFFFYMIFNNIHSLHFKTYLHAIFVGYRVPKYYSGWSRFIKDLGHGTEESHKEYGSSRNSLTDDDHSDTHFLDETLSGMSRNLMSQQTNQFSTQNLY